MPASRVHPNPDVMTTREAADYLGISTAMVAKLLHARLLPSGRIGARRYFLRSQLDAWLDAGGTDAEPAPGNAA